MSQRCAARPALEQRGRAGCGTPAPAVRQPRPWGAVTADESPQGAPIEGSPIVSSRGITWPDGEPKEIRDACDKKDGVKPPSTGK